MDNFATLSQNNNEICSFLRHGNNKLEQLVATCNTCKQMGVENICPYCISTCHQGHDVTELEKRNCTCDCGLKNFCRNATLYSRSFNSVNVDNMKKINSFIAKPQAAPTSTQERKKQLADRQFDNSALNYPMKPMAKSGDLIGIQESMFNESTREAADVKDEISKHNSIFSHTMSFMDDQVPTMSSVSANTKGGMIRDLPNPRSDFDLFTNKKNDLDLNKDNFMFDNYTYLSGGDPMTDGNLIGAKDSGFSGRNMSAGGGINVGGNPTDSMVNPGGKKKSQPVPSMETQAQQQTKDDQIDDISILNNFLAFDLLQQYDIQLPRNKILLFSYNIFMILAILYRASSGNAEKELKFMLKVSDADILIQMLLLQHNKVCYGLKSSSTIYVNENVPIKQTFKDYVKSCMKIDTLDVYNKVEEAERINKIVE